MPDVTIILTNQQGELFINEKDIRKWRLRPSGLIPFIYKKQRYFRLGTLHGVSYALDKPKMMLNITSPPNLFEPSAFKIKSKTQEPQRPEHFGFYTNYDINIPQVQKDFSLNALFDGGVFGPVGVITANGLFNDISNKPRFIRLNTTWNYDRVSDMQSLRVGDVTSQPGLWGNSVFMAGLQFSRNFSTRPNYITYPLPAISGQAVLPSLVDLYIDNALVYKNNVKPGPFSIDSLPIINGQGDVSLVTKDLLGRETVVNVSYYASDQILKKGLNDYSYSFGIQRQNYAINSYDYSDIIAVASHRYGFTNNVTGEVHAEIEIDQQSLGLGALYLWPKVGVLNASVAASQSHGRVGGLFLFGFERQAKTMHVALRGIATTENFRQTTRADEPSPLFEGSLFVGVPFWGKNTLGASLVSRFNRGGENVQLVSVNYNRHLSFQWNLTLTGLSNLTGVSNKAVFLTLTRSIGKSTSLSVNANYQRDNYEAGFQVNHIAPREGGIDYFVRGRTGVSDQVQASISFEKWYAAVSTQGAYQDGKFDFTADVNGGFIWYEGQWSFTRTIGESFGLVQVPGYKGVSVYVDNHLLTKTNDAGYAFIPQLRPYDVNPIRIDSADIPMSASIHELQLKALPYYHSGILVKFDVEDLRSAYVTVRLADKKYMPAGAIAQVRGQKAAFPVAYDGKLYITGLKKENIIDVYWNQKKCHFNLTAHKKKQALPDSGDYVCRMD